MPATPFTAYLADNYAQFRSLVQSGLGRRAAKLRMVSDFWALPLEEKERLVQLANDPSGQEILLSAQVEMDGMPLGTDEFADDISDTTDANVMGVVVRTDCTDDAAWSQFVEKLLDAEREFMSPLDDDLEASSGSAGSSKQVDTDDADSDESSGSELDSSFVFLDPPAGSSFRQKLLGMSNLAALRLLNDVDVARKPMPSQGTQSYSLQHRLIGLDGFVERYRGPLVWVYDSRSNTDGAARVISQQSESVESATADSWRARASFLPELQMHVSSGAMKVDFGGLDRWDQAERQRNMAEANASLI